MTGVLPIDKPAGPSSHDMVSVARRSLGVRRIGHTGTLDPFATGLLLLCVGTATRLAEYLSGLDKVYEATARLGVATDTLDHTGEVVAESDGWRDLGDDRVRAAFEGLAGTALQQPPAYSAKKIGGRKAYELARAGEAVLPDPVEVTIHSLEVTAVDGAEVSFRMRASSGTYVRAVARDAGDALGVGAHLTSLRRTAIGGHDVAGALSPDGLEDRSAVAAALIDPLRAVAHLTRVEVTAEERARIGNGQRLAAEGRVEGGGGGAGGVADGEVALLALAHDGELVAIAETDGHRIQPRKVFA